MEPKLPAPNLERERPSESYGYNQEVLPSSAAPERVGERNREHLEQMSEAALQASATVSVLPPPVIPTASSAVNLTSTDIPLVANDDDLIEKEWVDKAKKIITDTKDDPYRREQEVSKLQAEYLRKRYGRELGSS